MPLALVTGASGFVGGHAVERLLQEGFDVRATDVRPPANGFAKGVEFVEADITKKETLKKAMDGVDNVYHIAAVFDYSTPWEVLHKVNVEGTRNVMEAAGDARVKSLVLWGAVASYGLPNPKNLPITEDHPLTAMDVGYDRSKREQEEAAWKIHKENGVPLTVIRPGGIYGPRSRYGLYAFILAVAQGWVPGVPTNIDYKLPAVHVKDVAGAAAFLSKKREANGQAYNVVDDNVVDMRHAMKFIAAITDSHVGDMPPLFPPRVIANLTLGFARGVEKKYRKKGLKPVFGAESMQYMKGNYWVSNEKLKKAGYQLLYPDIRFGLLETVTWYRKEGML
ncbi:MAG: NAD-dependent epimerase/dehydratase family protein [Halobacteria archaeon]